MQLYCSERFGISGSLCFFLNLEATRFMHVTTSRTYVELHNNN